MDNSFLILWAKPLAAFLASAAALAKLYTFYETLAFKSLNDYEAT